MWYRGSYNGYNVIWGRWCMSVSCCIGFDVYFPLILCYKDVENEKDLLKLVCGYERQLSQNMVHCKWFNLFI